MKKKEIEKRRKNKIRKKRDGKEEGQVRQKEKERKQNKEIDETENEFEKMDNMDIDSYDTHAHRDRIHRHTSSTYIHPQQSVHHHQPANSGQVLATRILYGPEACRHDQKRQDQSRRQGYRD